MTAPGLKSSQYIFGMEADYTGTGPQFNRSGRKPEMHHVAVGDHVVLAFKAHLAGLFRAGFAAVGDEVIVSDSLGADEAALEIAMNNARSLRRLGALRDGPG